jgi:O-methyltransferase
MQSATSPNALSGPVTSSAGYAPKQKWKWLRPFIPKRLQPALRGLRKRYQLMFMKLEEPYKSVYPYTQAHPVRQQNLVRLADLIVKENIPGHIVECGVLDGGTSALMAWSSRSASPAREVHLFDAWEGLPATTAEDGNEAAAWTGEVVGSPTRVIAIMKKLGITKERVKIHRGWFDQTFPKVDVTPVALVHVDCDFYEPTRLCLEKWYPALSPGGFMQFDDYEAFSGCRKAVDEFLAAHPDVKLETTGDWALAFFFRKPG